MIKCSIRSGRQSLFVRDRAKVAKQGLKNSGEWFEYIHEHGQNMRIEHCMQQFL